MPKHRYDERKVREVILYALNTIEIHDVETLHAIIYFASKEHLSRHGRLIFETDFIARQWGIEVVAVTEVLGKLMVDREVMRL